MKKFATLFLALVMALSVGVALTACGDSGNVDTFNGAVSKQSYESQDDAIEGFLKTEISGEAVNATLKDAQEKRDLSQGEIDQLNLSALEEGKTVESAKEITVTYTRVNTWANVGVETLAAEPSENTFEITIYVLIISSTGTTVKEYHYYVPKAENGDVLTRSYFEDVLNFEKYANCTIEYTSKSTSKMSYAGMSQDQDIDQNYTVKLAEKKAIMQGHLVNPNATTSEITYMDMICYFEEIDGKLNAWMSLDNGATFMHTTNMPMGVVGLEDIIKVCLPQYDYSVYEKTSYGFKLQDEFLDEFLADALSSALGMGANTSATLELYVKDGRLDKLVEEASVSVSQQGASMKMEMSQSVQYSAFGSTTVEKPAGIE